MTLAELRAELQDSGLDHLSTTRANRFVNLAYRKVYQSYLWPWRLTTQTGATPLTVTTRGTIKSVTDSEGAEVRYMDKDELDKEVDLTSTSTYPDFWYVDDDGTIQTYPVVTGNITVRHYAKAADLGESDSPDLPTEYHYAVVLEAVRRGKLENGETEASGIYKLDYDAELAQMKKEVFNVQVQNSKKLNDV